jgi:cell division protein FtsB
MIKNALFLFVVLAAVFVVYLPSYMQMQDLRRRNEVFEKRIGELEIDNVKLAEERDRLKNDPEYFERMAREQMGLIREDEVVYKVVPKGHKTPEPVEEPKKKVAKPTAKAVKKTDAKAVAKKPAAKKSDAKAAAKKPVAVKTAVTKKTTKAKTPAKVETDKKQIKKN